MYLLNDDFTKKQIFNLVKQKIFVNLDSDEQDLITIYLLKLIHIIGLKYNIPYKYYKIQIFLNNSRDIYSLISLLLPYVDTKNNYENFKSLKKLSDIFLDVKYPGYKNNKINSKNLYKYSTIELDLGKIENKIFKNIFENEIKDNISLFLESNFRLILETIEILSFKSYINWINIFPVSYTNYQNSNLYNSTFRYNFDKNIFEARINDSSKIIEYIRWWNIKEVNILNIIENNISPYINYDAVNVMNEYSGIPINQVYDNFVKLYYTSIEKFKFFIEDFYHLDKKKIPGILYLDNKFNNKLLPYIKKNLNWEAIEDNIKLILKDYWINFLSHDNYIVNLIILYFEFYYENLCDLKDYTRVFGKNIKLNFNEYDLNDKIDLKKNNIKKISENFNNDNFKFIYDFLLNSFNHFKLTPYYFIIFDKNDKLFDEIDNINNNNNLFKIEKNTNNLYFIKNFIKNIKIKYEFFKFKSDREYEKDDGEILFKVNNIDDYLLIRGNDGKKRFFFNIDQINNNNKFIYIDNNIYREIFINNFNKLSKKDNNLNFKIVQKKLEDYLQNNNIEPSISIKDLNELFYKLENEDENDCNEYLLKLKKKYFFSSFIFPDDIFEKKVSDYNLFIKLEEKKKKLDKNLEISCFNLYNFGKLLYNVNYSPVWNNLNNLSKIYICDLFNLNFSSICNLENNNNNIYQLIKKNFSEKNNNDEFLNLFLFNYIRIYSFEITFKTLLRLGLLSEFKFNPELTDFENEIKGKDMKEETINQKKKLKIQIENYNFSGSIVEKKNFISSFKNLFKDNYYFLNNQKYDNIKLLKYKNLDYFDILLKDDILWFTKHCFNWLIQLDFYNKFINKSVLLITGGTGQGKSVHVPKLIHYGLKAIDLNLFGKTVITQPRITPVVNNAEYISNELMVPIKDYNPYFGENLIFTENGEVQYSHSREKYLNKSIFNYLQLCTDGSLLSNISQNILMKKKIFLEKKINTYYYLKENSYDIIGIDESHEHNVNMDLILTLLKYTIIYNKSIRLFIISATLDEDEPIYRRFYKNINESIKYPLNMNIYNDLNLSAIYRLFNCIEKKINIIISEDISDKIKRGWYSVRLFNNNFYFSNNDIEFELSNQKIINVINNFYSKPQLTPIRKLLDRRFHISPPGKVTQFEITEYYEEVDQIKDYDNITIKEVDNLNYLAINHTLNILNKSNQGEILLFTYSRSQCIKLCKQINEKTKLDVVALPFFSEMNYKYKEYLQNLDKYKSKINFNKNVIVDIYANEMNDKNIIGNNKYKRIIIIATNIAEASITIPNLKFVIDLGIQLTVKYDNENEFYENKITSITESSRLQRKGRVGRTDSGTVYYIYTKDSKLPVIPQYKICIENLNSSIYNHLLYKNYLEFELFYGINYHNENNYYYLESNFNKIIKKYNFLPEFNIFQSNFTYFYNKTQKLILKINDFDTEDFKLNKLYLSGFNTKTIIDNELNFYIIHPIQNKLTVDVRTGLISDDVKLYKINTNYNYLNILKKQNLIIDLNYKLSLNSIKNVDYKIAKTKINVLFTYLTNYMPSLNYNTDYYIIFIYSILLNCENEIIIILSALDNLQNYNQLFKLDKFINLNYEKIYKNKYSNVFNIINLVNLFFKDFEIYKINNHVNLYKEKYNLFQKIYNNDLKSKFDKDEWELFIKFKRELQLNNELNKKKFNLNDIESSVYKILDDNILDKWCLDKLINKNIFKKILIQYLNITKEYNFLITEEKNKIYNFFDILKQTIYVNKSTDKNINIIKSLLFGFKQNVVEYNGTSFNHLLSNNVFENKNLFRNMYDFNLNPTKFLFFLKKDPFSKNEIIFLINLFDPKLIFESGFNIYNLKSMVKKNNSLINYYDINLINKELIFIRFKESKIIEDIKFEHNNQNLDEIIDEIDKKNFIDNIEHNTINQKLYNNRYIILNILNFYYYFIKGLIKN